MAASDFDTIRAVLNAEMQSIEAKKADINSSRPMATELRIECDKSIQMVYAGLACVNIAERLIVAIENIGEAYKMMSTTELIVPKKAK